MKQRVITAIVLVVLFLPCVIVSGIPFKILIAFIGAMATYELLSITKEPKPHFYLYGVLGVYILGSLFFSKGLLVSNMFIVIYMVILLTCGIFDAGMPFLRISYYFTSATLVALGLHAIYYFRTALDIRYVIFLALATLGVDTFAYFVGRAIGKHKLNPRLSPKKTIEGSIGGIVCGGLLGLAYAYCVQIPYSLPYLALMSFVLATTGQIGDLTFSSIKRTFEVKDYSQIFPGHGGVLDRFDSIIFNSMILGFLLTLL